MRCSSREHIFSRTARSCFLPGLKYGRNFCIPVLSEAKNLASGYTKLTARVVSIEVWLTPEQRVAVRGHELGHVLLHVTNGGLGQPHGSSAEDRDLAEVEAESADRGIFHPSPGCWRQSPCPEPITPGQFSAGRWPRRAMASSTCCLESPRCR
ncbi:ImmA/IrrE family metallo-endopeptidase [Specibacter sp. RAF43]|uniref:ImmA/IrrE family metallo-endopeptidase n=1 Tax=Specibacter sp. RAF43 TaxID=3233057 RepID=UPI003F97D264